jgi:nucleoside 2-deoxyribosyltransferase
MSLSPAKNMKKSSNKITVYLAGPMRGKPYFNFLQFDAYQAKLEMRGYKVISPADLDRKAGFDPFKSLKANGLTASRELCLARDVKAITKVDALVLMPGWQKSRGAMMEVAVALFLDKPCYEIS